MNRTELYNCLKQDALANRRKKIAPRVLGDRIWKFILCLRYLEYYESFSGIQKIIRFPTICFFKLLYNRLSLQCGFSIPLYVFDKGLSIAHMGTIVVNSQAKVGRNCRIHDGVTIGSTSGSGKAPIIGNNCVFTTGAKIIGDISIADDVVVGANAVVVKSITEKGTTWGGVPAKKISNNNSHKSLSPYLDLE